MVARAGIVVTGTEVLTGRVVDRNGPWLTEQLRLAGVDVAHVVVVGDRPGDLRAALGFLAGEVDLVLTSGGLGPTADDLTAEIVAEFQGRPMAVDEPLAEHIGAIIERLTRGRGWRTNTDAIRASVRKQASVPDGAGVLLPAGTAPGLVVPPRSGDGPTIVVLPGPPWELQAMWPAAVAHDAVSAVLAGGAEIRQATMRLWGTPEHELAATMREHDDELAGLEITTCLRTGELEIVTRYPPDAQPAYDRFREIVADAYPATLFSPDGATIDEIVARLLLDGGRTIATAESCTGGLLTARLTELAGSSAYVMGALTTYSNAAKHDLAGVPTELIERVGAVSEEVAAALANGARERVGTDVGVGITGVAGPGGGTAAKPVGLVYLCAVDGHGGRVERRLDSPGSRSDIRNRAVAVAMHMIRELLSA